MHWLMLAWRDMALCGWISFAHGLVLALFGLGILALAHDRFWLMAGALSGFLVVAPVLATSLNALSRALERGEPANVGLVLKTWLNWQNSHFNKWGNDYWCLVQFGALLALAGTGWVVTSAALITLLAPLPIHTPIDFIRRVTLLTAVLTSWRAVLMNPLPLAFWATLIMGFTLLGLGPLLLGLVFVVPMLGHASWHAYRDLVDVSGLPPREPG
jgi:uncharacterized membrane protein